MSMNELIFLSEYCGKLKTAQVFRRKPNNDYVTVCYENGQEKIGHPFPTESQAEDFAEDWIFG